MKHAIKFLTAAFAVCAAPTVLAANDSGTITFTGSVSEAVCQVLIDTNGSIPLANVMPSALTSAGDVSGLKEFVIGLSGGACTNGVTPQLTFSATNFDSTTGYLINTEGTGGATGVAFQLLNGAIPITDPSAPIPLPMIVDDGSSLLMGVQYVRTIDPIKSGKISSVATFNITYQ